MSSPNRSINSKAPLIHVSNLTYTYEGNELPALHEINLDVFAGEFVIIAGPSGSGKSTLARCLTGFIPNEYPGQFDGTVSIVNIDTKSHSIPHLAQSISLIQQDPDSQLVTLKVSNEVAFGLENFLHPPESIATQIGWALNAINAENLHNRNTHTLSGGEKQKLVIASFLALQPPILIFDEPIARLDFQTTSELIKAMQNLHRQGITILVIEHRIQPFLNMASRILLMNKGWITFDGSSDLLSTQSKKLTDLGVALHPSAYSNRSSATKLSEENLLEIRNLSFTYPRVEEKSLAQPALQNLTLSFRPGEMVALMGANGSGKSTLLLQIMGLLTPDSGTVHLRNQNIHEQPVSQLARDVGFIFQNPLHQLFASTVKEEVLLASKHLGVPEPQAASKRAKELLETFGLLDYEDQSPYTLSLGEQRRLTIASIMLHSPQVLLLDEPFIGQDYRNVHRLMTVLQQEALQGTTILMATHDPAIAETYSQRLLFLFDGQLLIDAPIKQGLEYTALLEQTKSRHKTTPSEDGSEK